MGPPKGIHNSQSWKKVHFQIMNFLIDSRFFLSFCSGVHACARSYLYALAHWSSPFFFKYIFSITLYYYSCCILHAHRYLKIRLKIKRRLILKKQRLQLSRTGSKSREITKETTEWFQSKWTKKRNYNKSNSERNTQKMRWQYQEITDAVIWAMSQNERVITIFLLLLLFQ